MRERRRGVTTSLNYALLLAVVTILVGSLLAGVGGFVTAQEERAVGAGFVTVGTQLAADVETADRLVGTADATADSRVRVQSDLPSRVVGSNYRVTVDALGGDRYELVLTSTTPDVRRSVVVRSTVGIRETTVGGGPLVVEYDPAASQLVVRRA